MDRANRTMIIATAALLLALTASGAVAGDCWCGGRTAASGGGAIGELDNGVVDCRCQPPGCYSSCCATHREGCGPTRVYVPTAIRLQLAPKATPVPLFDELRQQHRQVGTLMDLIARSRPAERAALYNQLRMALIPHMKAEEATLYAALEQTGPSHASALLGEEEHHAAADVLGELDMTPLSNDRWMARFLVLKEAITRHVSDEEGKIFADARRALSPEQFSALYAQFNTQEQKIAAALKPLAVPTAFSGSVESNQGLSTTRSYEFANPAYDAMQFSCPDNSCFDEHLQSGQWPGAGPLGLR